VHNSKGNHTYTTTDYAIKRGNQL